ncbi:MAG: cytochrome c oxidase cbb3-type subunit 4 [Sulfitobacter sp.]|jgi:cytochrome c oxidase cbb3-type subunit IV
MHTYSWMREFADSWMLLAMTLFFLGVVVWAFRPGSRKTHLETAQIPFRNDTTALAPETPGAAAKRDCPQIGDAT